METIWLDSIDSTNTEAFRRLENLPPMTALAAREQTAGRGQRGNQWFAAPGENLTFSIVLQWGQGRLPSLAASDVPQLSFFTPYVTALFVQSFGVECSIKWPNDIYVGKRKLCGMLIENSLADKHLAASVLGIGLNVNQREFVQLLSATSLSLCTGESYDVPACLQRFLSIFQREWPRFGTAAVREAYDALLFRKGVSAPFHDVALDRDFDGIIRGVSPDGRLQVEDPAAGALRSYAFKEVSYIL